MTIHVAPAPRPHRAPIWARFLAVPAVVVLLLAGLWLTAGRLSDDMNVAMALTAAWFGVAGAAAFLVARRWRSFAVPVFGTFFVTATLIGGLLAWSTFRDTVVVERVATAGAGSANVALASGPFTSDAHSTSGTASLIELGGERVLTLTDLDTDAGPDLRVYLAPGDGSDVGDNVDLGGLKGNKGTQQYSIPAAVDLDRYTAVVIWCRAFSVSFGRAVLERGA